jgi:hypothetical protein
MPRVIKVERNLKGEKVYRHENSLLHCNERDFEIGDRIEEPVLIKKYVEADIVDGKTKKMVSRCDIDGVTINSHRDLKLTEKLFDGGYNEEKKGLLVKQVVHKNYLKHENGKIVEVESDDGECFIGIGYLTSIEEVN